MLRISVPVSTANALLSANFTEFADKNSDTKLVRTLSYTVPDAVEEHVKFIFPTIQFVWRVPAQPHGGADNVAYQVHPSS